MKILSIEFLPLVGVLALSVACGEAKTVADTGEETLPDTTTSADTTSATETSSAGMEEATDFLPKSDAPAANECDPIHQDCPEGEKCVPYIDTSDTWDADKCVPVTGSGVVGDVCKTDSLVAGTDDCDENHLCWQLVYNDQSELVGSCLPFCEGTSRAPVCGEGESCQITNNGVVTVCVADCDPLLQDCGLEGIGCYIAGGQDFFTCQPISGGYDEDAPCLYTNDCQPGLFCSAGTSVPDCNASGCCTSYCDITDGSACAAKPGTECVAFFEQPSPLYANLGVCVSPI